MEEFVSLATTMTRIAGEGRSRATFARAHRPMVPSELAHSVGSPDDLVEMARNGIERVTPLLLAIRRKQLTELISGIPTPPSRTKTKR